jgi:hypothetical protein
MSSALDHPTRGTFESVSVSVAVVASPATEAGGGDANLFAQVVSLYQSNSSLFSELKSLRGKQQRAREYLGTPGCNAALGEAHLLRLRARHSATLAVLRANRLQARRLLSRLEGDAGRGESGPQNHL